MSQLRRRSWFILAAFLLAIPPILYGAQQAWIQQSNRVEDWLPESFAETQELVWFVERFGGDELLMISWDGCTLDDPRVEKLASVLQKPEKTAQGDVQWFRDVLWAGDTLAKFMDAPLALSRDEAKSRLQGWLVGRDGKSTCLVALVSTQGAENRHGAVQFVQRAAENSIGITANELKLAGPTYDSVAIDNASKTSLLEFNLWSFAISFALLWVTLRSIRLAWHVFAAAFISEQLCLAMMYYSGSHLDSVLLLVANLTFVLTVAGGMHLVNYFRVSRQHGLAIEPAVQQAVREAARPTFFSAFTSAIGMITLTISPLAPVRSFGIFGAASVICAAGILLLVVPAAIVLFPPRTIAPARPSLSRVNWDSAIRGVLRFSGPIVAVAVVLLVVGAIGMRQLRTTVGLHDMFDPRAKVIEDYDWLESRIGNLIPIEIVVRWPELAADLPPREFGRQFVGRAQFVNDLAVKLESIDEVGTAISAATFLPTLPSAEEKGASAVARRRVLAARMQEHSQDLRQSGFYAVRDGEELWRISLRLPAGKRLDYGEYLDEIRSHVAQLMPRRKEASFLICGGVPLVYKTQSQLLSDLGQSFLAALSTITVAMIVSQRSIAIGILAMLPNALPVAIVLGWFGWNGWEIEIGGMMTASAALGVAMDDTLHCLTRFRFAMRDGESVPDAIVSAFRECGAAMFNTTLAVVLGLSVFALSAFNPIARFSWLMCSMLTFAILCNLIVLPAVLALWYRLRGRLATAGALNSRTSPAPTETLSTP
jgi:predicted RND superfamily exporter protein